MDNEKNFIITLSGEPASGKSTTYAKLKEHFEAEGYNVIKYSTGKIFRDFAQKWIDKNPGKKLADFNTYVESHPEVDTLIDDELKNIGIRLQNNYHPDKVFIIDSRIAWNFIPNSMSVRLTIDEKIAGQRVFDDSTRNSEDTYNTVQEATESTIIRKKSEKQRYMNLYSVDLENEDNYDLIIDTSYTNKDDVVDVIFKCAHLYMDNREFSKTWKNPKYFLPTQDIRQSISHVDEYSDLILKYGFYPYESILSVNVDGYNYVVDGHNRTGAAIKTDTSLIPYTCIAKDDEIMDQDLIAKLSARRFVKDEYTPGRAYDFEDCFGFRYTDVYDKYPKQPELDER